MSTKPAKLTSRHSLEYPVQKSAIPKLVILVIESRTPPHPVNINCWVTDVGENPSTCMYTSCKYMSSKKQNFLLRVHVQGAYLRTFSPIYTIILISNSLLLSLDCH